MERFTAQLISDISAAAAREVWTHSGHIISEKWLLEKGIRPELHSEAVERLVPYVKQMGIPSSFHPQFIEALWNVSQWDITTHIIPTVDAFFVEYCNCLRTMAIRRLTVTKSVVLYFDHFCEALRNSVVREIFIDDSVGIADGAVIKTLLLCTPKLCVVEANDIYTHILQAIEEKGAPFPEYHLNRVGLIGTYARLARWYQETNCPLEVVIAQPSRPDERHFVENTLRGRERLRNTDAHWIIEHWKTGRIRRREADMCPKCGEYDPHGKHYFRFVPGHGMYSCSLKETGLQPHAETAGETVETEDLEELQSTEATPSDDEDDSF